MRLHFKTEDVKRILIHSMSAKKHRDGYEGKTGPGLFLVGDEGVYLMSTGENVPNAGTERLDVVYAEECNPERMRFDSWWENKRASFGADDGADYLPAETFAFSLASEFMEIDVNPSDLTVIPSHKETPNHKTKPTQAKAPAKEKPKAQGPRRVAMMVGSAGQPVVPDQIGIIPEDIQEPEEELGNNGDPIREYPEDDPREIR
jgi:hypothetical protein